MPAYDRMFGAPVTRGLLANRTSSAVSGTMNDWCGSAIACAQKAMLRGVSVTSMPTRALNHCRSASTSEINAIGVDSN